MTDIDESSSADLIEQPTEIEPDQSDEVSDDVIPGSPLISEVFGTDISELPIAVDTAGNGVEVSNLEANLDEE